MNAVRQSAGFSIPEKWIYQYLKLRSLLYTVESLLVPLAEFTVTGQRPETPLDKPRLFQHARRALTELLEIDAFKLSRGEAPLSTLWPEHPRRHFERLFELFLDARRAVRERQNRTQTALSWEAERLSHHTPAYFRRKYHFQNDGYLSEKSASLYEHQVEVLFAGAADSMRRLAIAPLRELLDAEDGDSVADFACGTGSFTRILASQFPKTKIVGLDVSPPYIDRAIDSSDQENIHFKIADVCQSNLASASQTAVVSVFLFHELPLPERKLVIKEAWRVLKPGGKIVIVDSLQLGDNPDLDESLRNFPKRFHEPFYAGYIKMPLENLLQECGFTKLRSEFGFFAKCLSATKPLRAATQARVKKSRKAPDSTRSSTRQPPTRASSTKR